MPISIISALFFLSGFAALLYQVCWQRLLAYAFGVDLESSTIVISCFMLGMGLGAILGGMVADRWRKPLLAFCIAELLIGVFGSLSPLLIEQISSSFPDTSRTAFALLQFCLLLLPTALMGATLPLLVVALRRRNHSIAAATGNLYFINTLGAATGALSTGIWLFKHLELQQVIHLAAFCNLLVGVGGAAYLRWQSEHSA